MIKDLEDLKGQFKNVRAPLSLRTSGQGWVLSQIDSSNPIKIIWLKRFALILTSLVFLGIFLFGFYDRTLAALPGSPLYPIKTLAEKVIKKVTGNSTPIVNDRANEIINMVGQKDQTQEQKTSLESVVNEYKNSVTEVKDSNKKSDTNAADFQKNLQDQHQQFTEAVKSNPEARKIIEDAIKVSEGD